MRIRSEQVGDEAAIHAVHAACFPTDAEARLVDRLRSAGRLAVSLAGAGLAPIAVLESHRRRGVGAALVRAGLEACRDAGFAWVVVLGEPAYYSRFGFRAAAEFGLVDEYGGGAAFQAIELVEGGLPRGGGVGRYAPEFAALGGEEGE